MQFADVEELLAVGGARGAAGDQPFLRAMYALLVAERQGGGIGGVTFPTAAHTISADGRTLYPGDATSAIVGSDGLPIGLSMSHDGIYDVELAADGQGDVRAVVEPWDGSPKRETQGEVVAGEHGNTFRFPAAASAKTAFPTVGGKCVRFEASGGVRLTGYNARAVLHAPATRRDKMSC